MTARERDINHRLIYGNRGNIHLSHANTNVYGNQGKYANHRLNYDNKKKRY